MNIIIIILIFILVLFIYLHIFYHLKTSDDLEVYELSTLPKERLEEICDLRQPLTFYLDTSKFEKLTKENILNNYPSFDIKLRDTLKNNSDTELFLPIILTKGFTVLSEDTKQKFISENNGDFLEETSLIKTFKANDEFLRPNMLATTNYDYIMGSQNSITPFRYELNYRNYLFLLSGKVKVKLSPPKSSKYLHQIKDYDNFEFRSPINVWNIQDEYKIDFDKIKCMEITLEPGKILFIPAYWWYSLKFEDKQSTILSFKYRTYMNTIAIFPHIFTSFLQKQNIKHNIQGNSVPLNLKV
jgi:hypothetical protein